MRYLLIDITPQLAVLHWQPRRKLRQHSYEEEWKAALSNTVAYKDYRKDIAQQPLYRNANANEEGQQSILVVQSGEVQNSPATWLAYQRQTGRKSLETASEITDALAWPPYYTEDLPLPPAFTT